MADEHKIETKVLTPEGSVYSGELFQLSVRTVIGEVGVRARHVPILARLVPHELRLYESESEFDSGDPTSFAAAEGWLEVFANKARVLIGEAIEPSELDTSSLKERLSDAEQRLDEAEEDSAAADTATRDKLRAEAFLGIAEG